MQYILLYDWFSFTAKDLTADGIVKLLGMDITSFEVVRGTRGYLERLYYDGVNIHYGGREEVWCEMSGQGCRTFESFGHGNWADLFHSVLSGDGFHITRLDVAFDDHVGLLDLNVLKREAEAGNYISKFKWGEVRTALHDGAITIYHGSPRSDVRFRIYDKAKERGRDEEGHWVRFEIQMRDGNAERFLAKVALQHIGEVFAGVVNNYLRYVKPPQGEDSNKRRWSTADFWYNFIHTSEKISLYENPGTEYNLSNLEQFVIHQAGAAAALYVDIFGLDEFLSGCKDKLRSSANPKYSRLRRRHANGCLFELSPDPGAPSVPDEKKYTCEICGIRFPESNFVWYHTAKGIGECKACYGSG